MKRFVRRFACLKASHFPSVSGITFFLHLRNSQDFEAWILQSGDLGVLQRQLDLLKRQQDEAALGAAAVSRNPNQQVIDLEKPDLKMVGAHW